MMKQQTCIKTRPISKDRFAALERVIPGGVNSPVRAFKGLEMTPLVAESGSGAMLYDVDGNGYIDYCMSWGALIHGHSHPDIVEAASKRVAQGSSFGCTTAIEERLARKIVDLVPSVEKIRFVSTGTEATMSAIRLARGFTERKIIIKFSGCYHGHADSLLVEAGSGVLGINAKGTSLGVPAEHFMWTACLPYNDVKAFDAFLAEPGIRENVAAVIVEPVAANMGVVPPSSVFLHHLRKRTKDIGALLIFDEVITGFRMGISGAEGYFAIQPDLSCFGKIIGGGFPAAAFGGRAEIMDCLAPLGGVYQAGTLSGNPVAMEAGYQALKLLEKPGFYEELQKKTDFLTKPIKEYIQQNAIPACLQQVGSCFTLFFGKTSVSNIAEAKQCNGSQFSAFFRYLFERGVYVPPSQFEMCCLSSAHSYEDLETTRDIILEFLTGLNK